MPINKIKVNNIHEVILPVWKDKIALSNRLITTIKQIFDFAIAKEYVSHNNPALLSGALGQLLAPLKNIRSTSSHYASLDYREIPDFINDLLELNTISSKAYIFSILTATRSKAVRFLAWDQIDIKAKTWEIPLKNDKSKNPDSLRTIILSDQAISILKTMDHVCDYVFYNRQKNHLSDAIFAKCVKTINAKRIIQGRSLLIDKNSLTNREITQHRTARASFKTWSKSFDFKYRINDDAVELCLLHKRKDPLNGAYDRSKLIEERREIMKIWGEFCFSKYK